MNHPICVGGHAERIVLSALLGFILTGEFKMNVAQVGHWHPTKDQEWQDLRTEIIGDSIKYFTNGEHIATATLNPDGGIFEDSIIWAT